MGTITIEQRYIAFNCSSCYERRHELVGPPLYSLFTQEPNLRLLQCFCGKVVCSKCNTGTRRARICPSCSSELKNRGITLPVTAKLSGLITNSIGIVGLIIAVLTFVLILAISSMYNFAVLILALGVPLAIGFLSFESMVIVDEIISRKLRQTLADKLR